MTRVLPVPAPARIKTGPLIVSTASLCCGFSELRLIMRGREFKSERRARKSEKRKIFGAARSNGLNAFKCEGGRTANPNGQQTDHHRKNHIQPAAQPLTFQNQT